MKVTIDLIEDIRESIANAEDFELKAGLLKEDPEDSLKLIYAGEAPLNSYEIDKVKKLLLFKMDGSDASIRVGELMPPLLISDMDVMMYTLKMDINARYKEMEIVGFGKDEERRKYLLLIKV